MWKCVRVLLERIMNPLGVQHKMLQWLEINTLLFLINELHIKVEEISNAKFIATLVIKPQALKFNSVWKCKRKTIRHIKYCSICFARGTQHAIEWSTCKNIIHGSSPHQVHSLIFNSLTIKKEPAVCLMFN